MSLKCEPCSEPFPNLQSEPLNPFAQTLRRYLFGGMGELFKHHNLRVRAPSLNPTPLPLNPSVHTLRGYVFGGMGDSCKHHKLRVHVPFLNPKDLT